MLYLYSVTEAPSGIIWDHVYRYWLKTTIDRFTERYLLQIYRTTSHSDIFDKWKVSWYENGKSVNWISGKFNDQIN